MNFHEEVGPLMFGCREGLWHYVLLNGIEGIFVAVREKDWSHWANICTGSFTFLELYLMYISYLICETNVAQDTLLACFTNLIPYRWVFSQQ